MLAVVEFIRAQFFNPLSTNLLYWVHWAKIPHILGLVTKNVSLQLFHNFVKESVYKMCNNDCV